MVKQGDYDAKKIKENNIFEEALRIGDFKFLEKEHMCILYQKIYSL